MPEQFDKKEHEHLIDHFSQPTSLIKLEPVPGGSCGVHAAQHGRLFLCQEDFQSGQEHA
jgi:hypothetical protein